MPYEQIAYEVADRVATITLDRPDKLNAFTVRMQRELGAAIDEVDADPEVRAVVLTGRGAGSAPAPTWCPATTWRRSESPTAASATKAAWWHCASSPAPSR